MATNYAIASLFLCLMISFVNGLYVCPLDTCAMVNCEKILASTCIEMDQVLMPYAGFCGCCPACVQKIKKGERCPGFLQLLGSPETAGCESGTMCQKLADNTFACI